MPKPYLQLLLAVTLIVAVGYYLTPGFAPDPQVSEWQQALPKTYLINTRTSTYNEEGTLTDVLEAQTAKFYPGQHQSLMESPRLFSHNLDDDTWSASSDNGEFAHNRKLLTLTNNVVLSNDINLVVLKTEKMRIDLVRNMAISKMPVTVTHRGSTTRADGMIADLDSQTVRLRPNVESIYVNPTH
jgi:lipopolysaccharide export system protein LptC